MLGWHDQRPLAQLLPAKEAKAFSRHFSFTTVEDLLQHFPRGYAAHGTGLAAEAAEEGDIITCVGTIVDTHEQPDRNGYSIYSVVISDGFTRSTATFFRATWIKKSSPAEHKESSPVNSNSSAIPHNSSTPTSSSSQKKAKKQPEPAECKHYQPPANSTTSPTSSSP